MGKEILKKPVITIDGTNLTGRISQLSIEQPDDEVDTTTFGSEFKQTDSGMRDASMGFTAFQDFAAAQVNAVFSNLKNTNKKFIVKVQVRSGEVSASNPVFLMGGKLFNYTPLSGSVGEASQTEPAIKNQTQLGIVECKSAAEVIEKEAAINAELV
jgi:hypothetical protein